MQKLQLQQKLQQKLTPQQILQIKLLEYTALELEEKILQELEENPALEEGFDADVQDDQQASDEADDDNFQDEDISLGDYFNEDDIPEYKLAEKQKAEELDPAFFLDEKESLHEALVAQLRLRDLSELEEKVGEYIIGNIDSDGYLRRELNSISDDLLFQADVDISVSELRRILEIIQDLDPAGIGAENLRECLLIQLRRKDQAPAVLLATRVIEHAFEEFLKRHYEKIATQLKLTEEELKLAVHEITFLNPKPGNWLSDKGVGSALHIIPDFIAETIDEEVFVSLNSKNIPELHVSRNYASILNEYSSKKGKKSKENKAAINFVKQKLDSAKWFIDALKQRHRTLLTTMEAIASLQHAFFVTGDESDLRPMILKDVAQRTGLDVSTVSRVSSSKYVQTNYGIFALKFFFSDGMQTDSGEEVSTREIKNILKEAIDAEDKRRPLIDEKLCEILNDKGYPLARRTVAKYRESLGIPVARMRKEM